MHCIDLYKALAALDSGWNDTGRKGAFSAGSFVNQRGRFYGLWHRGVYTGAISTWPTSTNAQDVALAMDQSSEVLAGLEGMMAACKAGLNLIANHWPYVHGNWEVGNAWGGLESSLERLSGRASQPQQLTVQESRNRWGNTAYLAPATMPGELAALYARRQALLLEKPATGEVAEIDRLISESNLDQERWSGMVRIGHPDFIPGVFARRWGSSQPTEFTVMEYWGDGDRAFGGEADDRPLLVTGRIRESLHQPEPVAVFTTLEDAHQAAAGIPNRRAKSLLGCVPWWR